MGETMQQYYRDEKDRRMDPVLPPDVFVHLRFPETDSRKEDQVYSEFFFHHSTSVDDLGPVPHPSR